MTGPTNVHPVRTVRVGDRSADIDEMLAPLVEALWRNGFDTFTSCQDAGESNADWVDLLPHMAAYVQSRKGWAFIDFPIQDGLRFLTAIAQAGPRDAFYVRTTHWAAPHAWDVKVKPMDLAMFDETLPSSFALRLLQVCFPASDLPEILHRLDRYEAGELVPPAATDWTTVGRPRPVTTVRAEVRAFADLGPLPAEETAEQDDIEERERRLHQIAGPVTDDEARLLVACFGVDNCYGLAWKLLHLVETAPTSRIGTEPPAGANEWVVRLWRRHRNAGHEA
ncbi:hypothetical protein ACL02O_04830 [Micromonospora sp. MS34]|uniref:hypothetical protein n=1 Tax=Micromonospora sp. MS34 TaxID=3385971 RepID=UPI0039A0C27E